MDDRDDLPFDDEGATIESAGKEHDQFRYEEGVRCDGSYHSDDAPEDDGEGDFCPDYVNADD